MGRNWSAFGISLSIICTNQEKRVEYTMQNGIKKNVISRPWNQKHGPTCKREACNIYNVRVLQERSSLFGEFHIRGFGSIAMAGFICCLWHATMYSENCQVSGPI